MEWVNLRRKREKRGEWVNFRREKENIENKRRSINMRRRECFVSMNRLLNLKIISDVEF